MFLLDFMISAKIFNELVKKFYTIAGDKSCFTKSVSSWTSGINSISVNLLKGGDGLVAGLFSD